MFPCHWETISFRNERDIWGNWPESSEVCEASVLKNCLPHTLHQFSRHQRRSPTMVYVVHFTTAFSELPAPSSDHTVAHNVVSMHVAQLAVNLSWRLLLSVQKSDNCTNIAAGGRQYQFSHFLLALCNNYCRHKTETALHYSHVLPLYSCACVFPSD